MVHPCNGEPAIPHSSPTAHPIYDGPTGAGCNATQGLRDIYEWDIGNQRALVDDAYPQR